MNLLTATSAFLALVAHVLIAASIATNFWLVYKPVPDPNSRVPLNPLYNDTGLSDRSVRYRAHHLGIWVACYQEPDYGKEQSCGFINAQCTAKVCWIRENGADSSKNERTCKRHPVAALTGKCTAFQAVRGLATVGTFFSILSVTFLFVSLCVMARLFAAAGSSCALLSFLLNMCAFAVFLGSIINGQKLAPKIATAGYSYVLLVTSWVIAFVAACLAYLGAFAGAPDTDDTADYESD